MTESKKIQWTIHWDDTEKCVTKIVKDGDVIAILGNDPTKSLLENSNEILKVHALIDFDNDHVVYENA